MEKEIENLLEDLDNGEEVKTKYGTCYAYSPDVVEELKQAITELKQIKDKFDENRKSDITHLSFNKFKEIHKNDTPFNALDILHRLSLAPDYVKPNSVEVWARRFLRDKVEQALTELKAIKEAKPSEAMKCLEELDCMFYLEKRITNEDGNHEDYEFHPYSTKEYHIIEDYILKAQEQEKENAKLKGQVKYLTEVVTEFQKVLKIIEKKCLYNDNLNYVAVCINYDMYKEKMSKKHDTVVVKTNWNDKVLLDYLKLLSQEEFDLLKRCFF